ncbi:CeGAL family transcription factor [Aspergillus novofumigatus IBT 16806]|uniref:Putative C6 transcription factor n=1 Tax=Aspergillus novofumigatus (strain IBT 16806) TaxID=1392255 RepID=A0A2I1BXE5_ASPN1|nr:putative C6 transcription factor [Aspergillus novofumigatus IBT 16806]PKX90054.1 putative C6 transcription factor [Aspergillus novofumigatus IBT 16806]
MATPSSPATALAGCDDLQWQHDGPPAKRRKGNSMTNTCQPSPREIGIMRETERDDSATFLGSSSGIHFIRTVYNAFAKRSAVLQEARVRNQSLVPGEDDQLQRRPGKSQGLDELCLKHELSLQAPESVSFESLVGWSRSYFEYLHPIFPFLHAPTVLKAMERVSERGIDSLDRANLAILRSILSISVIDNRQAQNSGMTADPIPSVLVYRTVQEAMESIHALLLEPSTLPLLQAVFSVQLVLTSVLRLNTASRVGGLISRTAFHLGLHRCPARFSCFSREDADIRRRLFWSIYCLERYFIQDDDIDVCYPGSERHGEVGKVPQAKGSHSHLRLLTHLAKFARLRGLTLELRNKSILHSHNNTLEATYVNGELAQWWNEVYDDVYPMEEQLECLPQNETSLQPSHRLLLVVLKHESIISMNRPLLAAERLSPEYKPALQACIESSRSLISALRTYLLAHNSSQSGQDAADSGKHQAPLTWPSFTWATWMACLILMYAASEGEFSSISALKYAKVGVSILENLSLRKSSWPDTCIEAIKGMESALRVNLDSDSREQTPLPRTFARRTQRTTLSGSSERHMDTEPNGRRYSLSVQDEGMSRADPLSSPLTSRRSTSHITGRTPGLPTPVHEQRPMSTQAHHPSSYDLHNDQSTTGIETDNMNDLSSAGLIFGDTMGSHFPYAVTAGQDIASFATSDPCGISNLWSIADWPWMIHENFS